MGPTILLALLAVSAGAVERSTATPQHVFGGPIRFQFRYDHRSGPVAEVGYLLRWDRNDIKRLPGGTARLLINPFGTAERATRELFSSADVGVYSMRFRLGRYLPMNSLLRPLSMASEAVEAGYSTVRGEPSLAASKDSSRRHRLKFTPVIDDIEKNLHNEIRRGLLTTGFDLAVPAGKSASFSQKEAVIKSLQEARETWEYDLMKVPPK